MKLSRESTTRIIKILYMLVPNRNAPVTQYLSYIDIQLYTLYAGRPIRTRPPNAPVYVCIRYPPTHGRGLVGRITVSLNRGLSL